MKNTSSYILAETADLTSALRSNAASADDAPLTVRWTDENGCCEALTETRDVSARGLCFHLSNALKNGSAVEIVMTLPKRLIEAGPVCVRCQCRVARSLEGLRKIEVAVAIEKFQLVRLAEDQV